ncbi:VOC family protein [Brucella sp. BE17]|uniref:VOC family protein n=1 Tax=Brucella sp. BE17 TaxID=3142977 RepID=UPI0031BAD6E2
MSVFDHIAFKVSNIGRSRSFYESCMPKLGLSLIARSSSGFFINGGKRAPVPFMFVSQSAHGNASADMKPGNHLHLMFAATSREAVQDFFEAAMKAGGTDSSRPGYQGAEEMGYYAALVHDPDGNTLEAGFRERKR